MSNASGIKVKGYKQIVKSLKAVGIPQKEINAAGKIAGEKVLLEAKTLVPVRTGALRNSIKLSSTMRGISIKAGSEVRVPYANPIHWGWYRRHIKPNPFLANALGYNREEIYESYFAQLELLITQQSTKGTIK
jgi:hypothetical protein